jgi:hypothetical protein
VPLAHSLGAETRVAHLDGAGGLGDEGFQPGNRGAIEPGGSTRDSQLVIIIIMIIITTRVAHLDGVGGLGDEGGEEGVQTRYRGAIEPGRFGPSAQRRQWSLNRERQRRVRIVYRSRLGCLPSPCRRGRQLGAERLGHVIRCCGNTVVVCSTSH